VELGYGVVELGGGRRTPEDSLDPRVGFVLAVAPGDKLRKGDPLGEVHAADTVGLTRGRAVLKNAVVVGGEPPPSLPPLIHERVHP
jgi:thymidine phosphorylase